VIDGEVVAFVAVATVVTLIPGADMALVARNVLAGGPRAGYLTSVGICAGLLVHALASAVGLSAILMTSAALFSAVKLAGAVYLVALGLASLRRAFAPVIATAAGGERATGIGVRHALGQGLASNLLNPKIAVFYLTLLPQFIRPGDSVLARSLLLAAIHMTIGLVWLFVYAYFLGWIGNALRRATVRRALEGATGVALVGLGARLAWERR
jgi:threonine/homoserine/homoserine lactone efflux protein